MSRIQITLACVYLFPIIGFAIRFIMIFLPIKENPLMHDLYISSLFLGILGAIFIILFNISLLRMDNGFTLTKQAILTLLFIILFLIVLNFSGGITINEDTNWNPQFTLEFFYIFTIFFSLAIVLPYTALTRWLYRDFQDKILRKKLLQCFLGFLGMASGFYGLAIYNTWENEIFKLTWNVFGLLILLLSAISIYYGTIQYY